MTITKIGGFWSLSEKGRCLYMSIFQSEVYQKMGEIAEARK